VKNGDIRQHDLAAGDGGGQPVRIMGFVDGDVIPPSCYDRPYRLEPGKDDDQAYDVLRETMQRTRKVGLAAVVIEKREALAAVIPIGRTLVLNVLRLASGLIPGASREVAPARPALRAVAQPPRAAASPRAPAAVAKAAPARAAVAAEGEVIDLAVRRTVKRASAARAKPARGRAAGGPATLHELKRKPSRSHERQLA